MDAAALLLLVSGVGVAFGWQPMPDGSQQYEYIVQLEPELAQTLADGRSIPIVSDVPAEVQPIGRIRIVVGRNEPPRQRLVTRLKPATGEGGQDSGVQLTQYNRYGDDRYTAAPAQQPPTSTAATERLAANPDPYGAAQSRSTPQESGESAWNSEQEEPPITPTGSTPPSGQELFGQSSTRANSWNADAAVDSAANAAAQTVSQLGSQLQQNAQPLLQKGVQQIDSQVQAAADKFGNRTRELVNELRQPFQQPQAPANTQQGGAASATAAGSEQSWNQGDDQATPQNPLRGDQQGGATWNNQQPQTSQTDPRTMAATPGSSSQTSTPAGSASIQWNTSTSGQSASPGPGAAAVPQQPGADPWAGVPDPRTPAGAAGSGGIPGVATRPLPFGGLGAIGTATGPEFPNVDNAATQSPPGGQIAATQPAAGAAASPGTPEVRSHMLQQPGDRPLDGVTTPGAPAHTPTTAATASAPASNTWGAGAQAQTTPTSASANLPAATTAVTGPTPAKDNTVAILFAWVMLTGSVAGNFYLFWSYLDVRQKYRSLVRKTARAVGSRFSAA